MADELEMNGKMAWGFDGDGKASGETVMKAIQKGDMAAVVLMVEENKGLLTYVDERKRGLVDTAASYGHKDILDFLLEQGCDPNVREECDQTPIQHAMFNGYSGCTESLLKAGADMSLCDISGWNAFHWCCYIGKGGIRSDTDRRSYASIAAEKAKCLRLGLEYAKDVCERPLLKGWYGLSDGSFPIHGAAVFGLTECLKTLIEAGNSIIARDFDGNTALDMAIRVGQKETALVLMDELDDEDLHDLVKMTEARELVPNEAVLKQYHFSKRFDEMRRHKSTQNLPTTEIEDRINKEWDSMTEEKRKLMAKTFHSNAVSFMEVADKLPEVSPRILDTFSRTVWLVPSQERDVIHDYTFARGPQESTDLLGVVVKRRAEDIVRHEVYRSLLDHKWKSFGFYIFTYELLLRVMLEFFFVLWVNFRQTWDDRDEGISRGLAGCLLGLSLLYCSNLLLHFGRHMRHLSTFSSLPRLTIEFTAGIIFLAQAANYLHDETYLPSILLSLTQLVHAFSILRMAVQHPSLGPLLIILYNILGSIVLFFVAWLLVSFPLLFSLQLLLADEDKTVIDEAFESMPQLLITMLSNLVGNPAEFGPLFEKDVLSAILVAAHLFVTIIVLVNLLIAMLNDKYVRVMQDSQLEWKFQRSYMIFDLETTYSFLIPDRTRWIEQREIIIKL